MCKDRGFNFGHLIYTLTVWWQTRSDNDQRRSLQTVLQNYFTHYPWNELGHSNVAHFKFWDPNVIYGTTEDQIFVRVGYSSPLAGRSGLVVSASDCMRCHRTKVRFITPRAVVFIAKAAAIYSIGHGLRTFTAVPRSTQLSTLRGTVKWISAYGLSNNNNGDGGCGWYLPIFGGITAKVDWLNLGVGG